MCCPFFTHEKTPQRGPWNRLACLALGLALVLAPAAAVHADETVRRVQEELRKRNLYFGDVDGLLTATTSSALRRYQQRKGFDPNGQIDVVTLRSLMIPAPAGQAAVAYVPGKGPSPAPPDGAGPIVGASVLAGGESSWPDITVLRSDEARRTLSAADAELAADRAALTDPDFPSPPPTPRPPPAAASRQRATSEEVRAFIARYLQAGQANDPHAELAFYGERVDYFDEGSVDKPFIEEDIARYDRRWPDRRFTLLEPFAVEPSPDGDPARLVVRFRYEFMNKGAKYLVQGKTDNVWTLTGTRPADLRIVAMKEQRVRE